MKATQYRHLKPYDVPQDPTHLPFSPYVFLQSLKRYPDSPPSIFTTFLKDLQCPYITPYPLTCAYNPPI